MLRQIKSLERDQLFKDRVSFDALTFRSVPADISRALHSLERISSPISSTFDIHRIPAQITIELVNELARVLFAYNCSPLSSQTNQAFRLDGHE